MACLTFREVALKQLGESMTAHLLSWLEEFLAEYFDHLLGWQSDTGEDIVLSLEDPVAWKLNCSESTRVMKFRLVNCHEAGLALLWYNPDIAL